MLSLAKVSAEMASSYFDGDDYYTRGDQDTAADFCGTGAIRLGINGAFKKEIFEHLLDGRTPNGDSPLIEIKRRVLSIDELSTAIQEYRKSVSKLPLDERQSRYLVDLIGDRICSNKAENGAEKLWDLEPPAANGCDDKKALKVYHLDRESKREVSAVFGEIVRRAQLPSKDRMRFQKAGKKLIKKVAGTSRAAGVDATFSAPKSVSIAALVGGKKELVEAHQKAVSYALTKLEQRCAMTRVSAETNRVFKETGNLVVARFQHGTSRAGDPQIHTHSVIFNATYLSEKGCWRSLDNREIFRQSKLLGVIYQNKLAELVQGLEYEIEVNANGTFELAGYTRDQLQKFSKRRAEVLENSARIRYEEELKADLEAAGYRPKSTVKRRRTFLVEGSREELESRGFSVVGSAAKGTLEVDGFQGARSFEHRQDELISGVTQRANRAGVLRNRAVKDGKSIEDLEAQWQGEAEAAGIHHPEPVGKDFELGKAVDYDYSMHHLKERRATWRRSDLELHALVRNLGRTSFETIQAGLAGGRQIMRTDDQHPDTSGSARERLTTLQQLAEERECIKLMKAGFGRFLPLASGQMAEERARDRGYTEGQTAALKMSLASRDQFCAWVGVAGSGKSYALADLKDVAEAAGLVVVGLAPDASSAKELGRSIGTVARTVDRWLVRREDGAKQGRRGGKDEKPDLLIVDEAGKLSTGKMLRLMKQAQKDGIRVVFTGDHRQFSAVEAGNPFRALCEAGVDRAVLNEHRRQKDADLLRVVTSASNGDPLSVDLLRPSIKALKSRQARIKWMAKTYLALPASERQKTLIIADLNRDRQELTGQLRQGLKASGALGRDDYWVSALYDRGLTKAQTGVARHYMEGDVLIVSKSALADVVTGEQYVVKRIDKRNNQLVVSRGGNETVMNPTDLEQVSVFVVKRIAVSTGESLIWRKNHEGRINREQVAVTGINGSTMDLAYDDGRRETVDLSQPLHLDYGLVQTTYSSQGKTAERVLYMAESSVSRNAWYVALSRAKYKVLVVTDSMAKLTTRVQKQAGQANALDYMNGKGSASNDRSKADSQAGMETRKSGLPRAWKIVQEFANAITGQKRHQAKESNAKFQPER